MKIALRLALLAVPALACAQERVLPADVLVGGLDPVLAIHQASPNLYEVTQLVTSFGSGTPVNAATICSAAALAHMKGYPGLSLGAVDDGTVSNAKRYITVALLKDPGEVASLPASLKWLPYRDIQSLRQTCSQFIQPRYLWPAQ